MTLLMSLLELLADIPCLILLLSLCLLKTLDLSVLLAEFLCVYLPKYRAGITRALSNTSNPWRTYFGMLLESFCFVFSIRSLLSTMPCSKSSSTFLIYNSVWPISLLSSIISCCNLLCLTLLRAYAAATALFSFYILCLRSEYLFLI